MRWSELEVERTTRERRERESQIPNPYLSEGLIHLEENLPGPEDMTIFAVRVKSSFRNCLEISFINPVVF